MEIDVIESVGGLRILRIDFQHDIVLIQLSVDDGYFRLAKGAVNSLVESLRSLSKLRGSDTIIVQKDIEAAVLLVGVYVL